MPLNVRLDGPIDALQMPRVMRVEDHAGDPVRGAFTLGPTSAALSFRPEAPWGPGSYALVVLPTLEDPAGNRVGQAFEMAPGTVAALPSDPSPSRLPFVVSGPLATTQ